MEPSKSKVGRGTSLQIKNRFTQIALESIVDDSSGDDPQPQQKTKTPTLFFEDKSNSIVSENQSPDLHFRYSVNPYRGCEHGCGYCYARPTHEYLGFNAALDFETKVMVKRQAPELFRKFLSRKSWKPQSIAFSGVTDCYQPAERNFRLTRDCLSVALEFNQPVSIVTKNALILRDLDILSAMAQKHLVHVYLSITTLDHKLAREMEPRTSFPQARLRALRTLAESKVPVGVMVAPIIPGLNDTEIPKILETCRENGASAAAYVLLRLPLAVRPIFEDWVQRTQPAKAKKILSRIRHTRGGKINDSTFGQRMTGRGEIATQIQNIFKLFQKKYHLDQALPQLNCDDFRQPGTDSDQLRLF